MRVILSAMNGWNGMKRSIGQLRVEADHNLIKDNIVSSVRSNFNNVKLNREESLTT